MQTTEFEIAGHKLRFNPDGEESIEAAEVVGLVQSELNRINPNPDEPITSKKILLVALKIAADKVKLEKDYQSNLKSLQESIDEAMSFIDKFSVITEGNSLN
jgi:cell division protein ZapA (FtsZ GTPase activity inhibitor)